jgi:sterol desaturase/sphingolipid hydroxylase (fatty acid hydroxylase superfamily)
MQTTMIVVHHSGYDLPFDTVPFFGSMAEQHDLHHERFNVNFGVIGLMDYLHGTAHYQRKAQKETKN